MGPTPHLRLSLLVATVVVALHVACRREAPSSGTTAAASLSSAPSSVSAAACAPWPPRGFTAKASTHGGRADFFTEVSYNDASGMVAVLDSDVFTDGKESDTPRITDRTRRLAPAERDALVADLFKNCATPKVLEARCAPGGCTRVEILPPRGSISVFPQGEVTVIENNDFAYAVFRRLAAFFPELRINEK